ncbi:MAG: hypothetical protein H8E46_12290 [FCB group bacterium]|nr:hypothetical protein [FCB group bacterium]
MKKALLTLLTVVLLAAAASAQKLYTASVVDTRDYEYTLSDLYFQYENDTTQFFRCIQGRSKFGLHFSRIDSIAFLDSLDHKMPGFRESSVTFLNGKTSKIHIYQFYTLTGDNSDIGTRVEIPVSDIKSMIFRQGGTYKLCGLCGITYHDLDSYLCPFDGEELTIIKTDETDTSVPVEYP